MHLTIDTILVNGFRLWCVTVGFQQRSRDFSKARDLLVYINTSESLYPLLPVPVPALSLKSWVLKQQ